MKFLIVVAITVLITTSSSLQSSCLFVSAARQVHSKQYLRNAKSCKHPCSPAVCHSASRCTSIAPYQCTSGKAVDGCSKEASTWPDSGSACMACCDVNMCGETTAAPTTPAPPTTTPVPPTPVPTTPVPTTTRAPPTSTPAPPTPAPKTPSSTPSPPPPHQRGCKKPCSHDICQNSSRCASADPYQCTAGTAAGGCSPDPDTWSTSASCSDCCDTNFCSLTTVKPNQGCPKCTETQCKSCHLSCPRDSPMYCFEGTAQGGCLTPAESTNGCCQSCCDTVSCPPPPTQPPHPPSPWDNVPLSKNCTLSPSYHGGPFGAPNPAPTPFGGMDVSRLGCRAWVGDSCCGFTPRFNWIVSTCSKNPAERKSMACRHNGSQTTALDLRYIAAYQWDTFMGQWNKDITSSTSVHPDGGLDLTKYRDGGHSNDRSDWDIKYAPTTNVTATQGLGPPAFMFVLSAKHISFAAFYALNQITLNRGPSYSPNCWGDSSGELDFLEVPFWADVELPINRWYVTTTADAGRCMPSQKNVPRFLDQKDNKQCSNSYCCEMCSCPNGTVCFGKTENIGYSAMGCVNVSQKIPKDQGFVTFDVDGDNLTCGHHFGAVAGGATSDAYFEQPDDGDRDVMFAVVVDRDGTFVYRWPASRSDIWPGITANFSADILLDTRPRHVNFGPPCPKMKSQLEEACGIWEPSCLGDCPLISAGGNFGPSQVAGAYAAEAARDGLNWWNNFVSTQLQEGSGSKSGSGGSSSWDSSSSSSSTSGGGASSSSGSASSSGSSGSSSSSSFWPPPETSFDRLRRNNNKNNKNRKKSAQQEQQPSRGESVLSPKHLARSEKIKTITPVPPFLCNGTCPKSTCDGSNKTITRCPDGAPFECTAGDAIGGCNAAPLFWPFSGHCKSCCDSKKCDFKCTICPVQYCLPIPHCPSDLPFQCTSGLSKGGCANTSKTWTDDPYKICDSCCHCAGTTSHNVLERIFDP